MLYEDGEKDRARKIKFRCLHNGSFICGYHIGQQGYKKGKNIKHLAIDVFL
jgi:hypothetical protein